MEKRLLLAVTLSIVVMLLYPLFLNKTMPPTENIDYVQDIENKEDSVVLAEKEKPVSVTENRVQQDTAAMLLDQRYAVGVSSIGGSLAEISIKNGGHFDIELVKPLEGQSSILSIDGTNQLKGLSTQAFDIKEDTKIVKENYNGFSIEKNLRFLRDVYGLEATIKIKNLSNTTQDLNFSLTTASNISNKEIYESRYIGADILSGSGKFKRIAGGNFKKYKELRQQDIIWLALKNKYYSIIAKPDFKTEGVFVNGEQGSLATGFLVRSNSIAPGETRSYNILFYIGPTEINELKKCDKSFGEALNFGIFTSISLILLSVLKFFYGLFHNYGIAILLLTCCISFMLFPLSFKSLKSMKKLQDLQPHMEKLRAEHKDSPQKLNKEMMELYRRHNVNPMGGCLPMFLQMPVFIALYQTLMRSVELKGAEFLWIKDLSLPDAAFNLPFSLPFLGSHINILPILMIGAMIIQQKISGASKAGAATDQQKMMSSIMPVMFGFIFYSLPSGLVLYWLTNTLLTSSLQYFSLKRS